MIVYITPFLLYFFCIVAFRRLIPFLKKMSLIDYPTERSNHTGIVPKGAGILIMGLFIFSISIALIFSNVFNLQWIIFILALVILFIVSLIDDLKSLSAPLRLFFHFFSVIISIFALRNEIIFFSQQNILSWINYNPQVIFCFIFLILALIWVWIINLFNFMDGMDGLTCFQILLLAVTINILSVLGLIDEQFQYVSLILISLFLAFLKFNFPPAKIFLGDVGSIPLGYITGLILIKVLLNGEAIIPILIILLFHFSDSTLTLIIRLIKKRNIMIAHSDHFFQKIIRTGQTHYQVLKKIIFLFIILFFLSMLSIYYPFLSLALGIFFTTVFLYYIHMVSKK